VWLCCLRRKHRWCCVTLFDSLPRSDAGILVRMEGAGAGLGLHVEHLVFRRLGLRRRLRGGVVERRRRLALPFPNHLRKKRVSLYFSSAAAAPQPLRRGRGVCGRVSTRAWWQKRRNASRSELSASPSELLASPSELSASPSELSATPSELLASLSELSASPSELVASPSELSASPSELSASPSELLVTPSESS
jgi:hypothetical protein